MGEIWTMGEMLVEIMRPEAGLELFTPGPFVGPFPSGAPAIFIDTVARLDHSAGIMGGVGLDDFGKNILERLKKDGVNTDYVLESARGATAVAFVTYFADGSRKFIFHIGNTPAVQSKDFDICDIESPKFFHIMGCSLMAHERFKERIIRTARTFAQHGARISFDPNIRPELLGDKAIDALLGDVLDNCSVIFPGIEELKLITGIDHIQPAVEALFNYPKMEIVALKKGSRGCTVYTRSQKVDCPPYIVDAVDPTGAGDCFDAAFLCGLLEEKSLLACARMASAAGALNTVRLGPMEGDISVAKVNQMIEQG